MMNSTVHVTSERGHRERGHRERGRLQGMLNLALFRVDLWKGLSTGHLVAHWMGHLMGLVKAHSMGPVKEHFSLGVEIVYCDCS
tara:strand:+ start:1611 stop:1862 length:252 start_codon:yes stop_codon:yes gene_type:complete